MRAGASMLVNRAGNVENYDELRYTPQAAQPVRTCELLFYKMYILASGDVVLCCMDWRRQVVLGNVRQQRLRDIWNGDAYRRDPPPAHRGAGRRDRPVQGVLVHAVVRRSRSGRAAA